MLKRPDLAQANWVRILRRIWGPRSGLSDRSFRPVTLETCVKDSEDYGDFALSPK
jgi:hypothetical protein